jgi:hypothetical protein
MDRQGEQLAPHVSRLEPVTMGSQRIRIRFRKKPTEIKFEPVDIDDPVEPGVADEERRWLRCLSQMRS